MKKLLIVLLLVAPAFAGVTRVAAKPVKFTAVKVVKPVVKTSFRVMKAVLY